MEVQVHLGNRNSRTLCLPPWLPEQLSDMFWGPPLGIRGVLGFLALSAEKSWLPPWGSLLGLEGDMIILFQLWFYF